MEGISVAVAALAVTVLTGIIGYFLARRAGLPKINEEIESRMEQLNETMRAQLDALRDDFTDCKTTLALQVRTNDSLVSENSLLWRRVRLAEQDLLTLFREQKVKPPHRLTHPEEDEH